MRHRSDGRVSPYLSGPVCCVPVGLKGMAGPISGDGPRSLSPCVMREPASRDMRQICVRCNSGMHKLLRIISREIGAAGATFWFRLRNSHSW